MKKQKHYVKSCIPICLKQETVGIATTVIGECRKCESHNWELKADEVEDGKKMQGTSKYALNYSLVAAMQSIGAGCTAAQTVVSFLNLLGPKYFNSTYYTIEGLLGSAEELVKTKSEKNALKEEKNAVSEQNSAEINGSRCATNVIIIIMFYFTGVS